MYGFHDILVDVCVFHTILYIFFSQKCRPERLHKGATPRLPGTLQVVAPRAPELAESTGTAQRRPDSTADSRRTAGQKAGGRGERQTNSKRAADEQQADSRRTAGEQQAASRRTAGQTASTPLHFEVCKPKLKNLPRIARVQLRSATA